MFFEVVGTGAELERLKALVVEARLEQRVRFWGSLRGRELETVVRQCQVGISSIGMHRLDVDTSNLKSREFCARGLPFVLSYDDRDFNADLPFVYRAAASDEPVDVEAVASFRDQLRSEHPNFPSQMRAYAESHLTWRAKMQPVLESLRTLLPASRGTS